MRKECGSQIGSIDDGALLGAPNWTTAHEASTLSSYLRAPLFIANGAEGRVLLPDVWQSLRCEQGASNDFLAEYSKTVTSFGSKVWCRVTITEVDENREWATLFWYEQRFAPSVGLHVGSNIPLFVAPATTVPCNRRAPQYRGRR